jgi:hypothetical protein
MKYLYYKLFVSKKGDENTKPYKKEDCLIIVEMMTAIKMVEKMQKIDAHEDSMIDFGKIPCLLKGQEAFIEGINPKQRQIKVNGKIYDFDDLFIELPEEHALEQSRLKSKKKISHKSSRKIIKKTTKKTTKKISRRKFSKKIKK